MKVFITGGSGFIGSHIVRELLEQGHRVTVLTRKPDVAGPNPDARRVSCEWRRDALGKIIAGHDVVIHNSVIWEREEELDDVRASLQLFEAAADARVQHQIYTSSTAVHRPFTPRMNEFLPLRTSDLYGATKAANELFLSAVSAATGLPFTVFRVGPMVGNPLPGVRSNADRRIRAMIATAREGGTIEVGAEEGRQFVGVRSLAKLYAEAVLGPGAGQTYVAVADPVIGWADLARRVVLEVGSGSISVLPAGPQPFVFDTQKVKEAFTARLQVDDDLNAMFAAEAP